MTSAGSWMHFEFGQDWLPKAHPLLPSAYTTFVQSLFLLRYSATALAEKRAFPVGISMEGSERYISRKRHEPVAFPRTIPLPGRLLVPAIRREGPRLPFHRASCRWASLAERARQALSPQQL